MYNEGFQPWYRDRAQFDLRGTSTRQYFATEEGLAAINTVLNANFKYLWMPAILYCKYNGIVFVHPSMHAACSVINYHVCKQQCPYVNFISNTQRRFNF